MDGALNASSPLDGMGWDGLGCRPPARCVAQESLAKIVVALGLKVDARDAAHPDARTALKAVLRAWLPLGDAVLGMAAEHLPCPRVRPRCPHGKRLLPRSSSSEKGQDGECVLHCMRL